MSVRGPVLRSLKNKLALLFLLITALAFAVVIFVFLPQLQSQLENKRIDDLKQEAVRSVPQLQGLIDKETPAPQLNLIVRAIADNANARVTLLGVQKSSLRSSAQFYVISDSNAETTINPPYKLAARALNAGRGGVVSRRVGSVGEVALPLFYQSAPDWVAVYQRKFDDEELDDATRDEFLTTMKDQVDRLQKLAVDLLDLSRLDAGSMQLNQEQVNLSELAQAVAQEFKPAIAQHETELDLRLPDDPVDAVCDR